MEGIEARLHGLVSGFISDSNTKGWRVQSPNSECVAHKFKDDGVDAMGLRQWNGLLSTLLFLIAWIKKTLFRILVKTEKDMQRLATFLCIFIVNQLSLNGVVSSNGAVIGVPQKY